MTTDSLLTQCLDLGALGDQMAADYAKMRARRLGLDEAEMIQRTLRYWHNGESHETSLLLAAKEMLSCRI
jgi:hypothetical protein